MHKIARYQVGLTKWKAGHQNIRFDSIKSGERFSVEREGRTSDRGLSFSIAHFGNYAIEFLLKIVFIVLVFLFICHTIVTHSLT